MPVEVLFALCTLSAVLISVFITRIIFLSKLKASEQQHLALQLQLDTLSEQLVFVKQQELHKQQELTEYKHKCDQLSQQLIEVQEQSNQYQLRNARQEQQLLRLTSLEDENEEFKLQLERLQQDYNVLQQDFETEKTAHEYQLKNANEKLTLLNNAEEQLQKQFESLANQLFKAHTSEFEKSSHTRINGLLQPLQQQLEGFRQQVNQQYVKEGQERASLKTEIMNLQQLNRKITEEAAALTQALKGDNKKQGNWGEMVLQRILEDSGLREGREYHTQVSQRREDGKLFQPDVVVHLPQHKEVIIDSKVSLVSYEAYFNASSELEQIRHLKDHINSLKSHVKGLGKKEYHELLGDRSLEYVLMFVPIEGAFLLAMDESPELIKLAMDNNVLLVSPTNLMVALRTIHNIWQYEYQNQNARDIAKKAADLYDKFFGFVKDMEKLGESIGAVQKRFDDANNKLYEGRGNLVKRVSDFQKLGVTPSKPADKDLLAKADNH